MTRKYIPTEEQRAFASHPAGAFVKACPGSGKTQTVISRLEVIAPNLSPRKGVAILSFTNSAVDEFTARLAGTSVANFINFPHFTGTFDRFIWHFLVQPYGIPDFEGSPILLDSWDRLEDVAKIRLSDRDTLGRLGVSLDLFDPGTGEIDPARVSKRYKGLRAHVEANKVAYETVAVARRRGLRRAGYLSAEDARHEALSRIRDASIGPALGTALAGRFAEVIIDEAQDCNPIDLELLRWLIAHNVQVTVISDPDQSIYEFRRGSPAELEAFSSAYEVSSILPFTGNFRSSPAICRFAATLRQRSTPDDSLGLETKSLETPVLIIPYTNKQALSLVGGRFEELLQEKSIGLESAIVLAHGRQHAQRAIGVVPTTENGSSKVERLARAVGQIWGTSTSSRSREAGLIAIEALLLEFAGVRQNGEHPKRTIERVGINGRVLRRLSWKLTTELPKTCSREELDRDAWVETAREKLFQLGMEPVGSKSVRQFLQAPKKGEWVKHLLEEKSKMRCSTVHEAKGHEYDAVCLVIPIDDPQEKRTTALFDAWEERSGNEAIRVVYVGATRAKRLLVVAVPESHSQRLAQICSANAVPHEVLETIGA